MPSSPAADAHSQLLWRELLSQRPSQAADHDPACAGIDEWLQRRDRYRTCQSCWEWLLLVWREDRAMRATERPRLPS